MNPQMNPQRSTPSGRRSRAGTLAVILALVAVVAVIRLRGGGARTIPEELLGTWTTAAPDYAGRALEMTPTTLRLHTSATSAPAYPVRRVALRDHGSSAHYIIEYERDGDGEVLALRLVRAAQPAIRIDHQDFVWRRRPETGRQH